VDEFDGYNKIITDMETAFMPDSRKIPIKIPKPLVFLLPKEGGRG